MQILIYAYDCDESIRDIELQLIRSDYGISDVNGVAVAN